jgi:hypothetical protein
MSSEAANESLEWLEDLDWIDEIEDMAVVEALLRVLDEAFGNANAGATAP